MHIIDMSLGGLHSERHGLHSNSSDRWLRSRVRSLYRAGRAKGTCILSIW